MEKGNLADTMKKLGLIGVLLAAQAKLSSGCHPHHHLVKEEDKCMKDLLRFKSLKATENNMTVHCKGMWDYLNCWPPASLGETVSQPCPEFFNAEGKVYRNCTANGWTDPLVPHEDACGYTFNETLHFLGEVACKVVLMFSNYSILANYSWLLVEGHFLFTLVSRSFFSLKKHLVWYIVLSWGIPLIVIVSWGCAKYFYEDEGCWETRKLEWIWWILRVPVLLTIFINLIFFLGILRILVSKLRMPDAQRNEFNQYKRLIKSTFFLVALFGLQYIVFALLPVQVSSLVFKIWTFAELALSSIQGFVVAVLYSFMNGEVQHEIQRRWRRWRLTQHLPSRPKQHHSSVSQSGSPHTQVSLLPCSPGSLTTSGLPMDTMDVI
ncbi:vasoactive intestinal polypeptide receptor-like isoform X2 [Thunnus maccoyii]|uniref:vasoactive intestinal polypeptide receptor-like isoform X2 n=1 Tax=Thunnus maccoyii TaxID=8240 RepID=UPI001C4D5185|nr:vasoactive intestinal polypeptide receptor-like isoform X2 [Thunnus maccoyii]